MLVFVLTGLSALGQSTDAAPSKPAQPIAFAVISVKQNKTIDWWVDRFTDDGYTAQGVTLEGLLMNQARL